MYVALFILIICLLCGNYGMAIAAGVVVVIAGLKK
jgi:hypothetical protein